jgi:hypothetical protein
MFDVSAICKRYFSLKLTVTGKDGQEHEVALEVAPAKLKTLKKFGEVKKLGEEDTMPEFMETVAQLLSNNKSGYKVPVDYIEAMDTDQLEQITKAYFDWLNATKKDPN